MVEEIKVTKVEEKKPVFTFDKNSVMMTVYLLYKANIITRHTIKHIFAIIDKTTEPNVMEFLVKEVAKLGE